MSVVPPAPRVRDASATRARILTAATAEFSRHGLAGARVDRIAAAADANKSLIYQYFGLKDDLFDAVFEAIVTQTVNDVPIDGADLPGYAGRLFDAYLTDPAPLRIGRWDELERDGRGLGSDAIQSALDAKAEAIAVAQRAGQVSDELAPRVLLDMIVAISRSGPIDRPTSPPNASAYRAAIVASVARLVDPASPRRPSVSP